MTRYEKLLWLKQWYNDHRGELQTQPSMVAAIKANRRVRDVIHDLYFALFNKSLGGCGSCLADALCILLHKSTEEEMKKIANCSFKLKPGVLLQDAKGKLPMVTIANLTDELAVAYLKDNPKRADKFAFIPEGWDAEPAEAEKPAEKPAEEAKKAEAEQTTTEVEKEAQGGENEAKPAQEAEATQEATAQEAEKPAEEAAPAPAPAKKTTKK